MKTRYFDGLLSGFARDADARFMGEIVVGSLSRAA
jgi:hypothetical protein